MSAARISYQRASQLAAKAAESFSGRVAADILTGFENHFAGRTSAPKDDFMYWLEEAIDIAQWRAENA